MELTAAGLLTLGGPMVGAPRDGFRLALISLSIGLCFSMLGWACEARERFCQGRKEGKPKRDRNSRSGASLLCLFLLPGRAADDASDASGRVCFARAQHYRRDASLRAQRRDGRGARAVDGRHHGLGWKISEKRMWSDPKQKYNMGSIDVFRRDDIN